MKETLTKLGTGLIAKLIRYALTGAGGVGLSTSMPDGQPINFEHLAAGLASIVVALGWSLWEDRIKKQQTTETKE